MSENRVATIEANGAMTESPGLSNTLVLIRSLIERGGDMAQIEKILDFQERLEKNQAKHRWAEAMAACQKEMPAVLRDAENKQTNSRYAKLESMVEVVKPIYTRHGFSVTYGTEKSEFEKHIRVYIDVHHGIHSQRTAADFPLDDSGLKGTANKTPMHATASSINYARRYLLQMAFNLTTTNEDHDGNGREEFLTPDEIGQVNDLIAEIRKKEIPFNFEKFLEWLKIGHLGEAPRSWLPRIVAELKRKAATQPTTAKAKK